ncbi:serine/threonine protein kinase [Tolypothrix tenuis PCC 7101]|uniref:non-specific serine/threonine protein kinase n=1 Tax=Tolypothrix tenuis PCC 7101 TaxID=231146 RepID=A0A1Z4MSL7_9CYAN|nr:serine/threonine protein kinase [Aulosira sp. FACHB-113]BAY96468.1 serine/threonine protein kinase [Tolypothrix tenuis PCC 7101]BAZ73024.1 serine/threonine protein kinase [Aulosira laxa NIES-50]
MLGQLLDGRYRIIKELGAGGFGQTFIAEDTKLYNTQCVVKLLKPLATDPITLQVARRLFESEAQLLHKLGTHDQIPQLLAHFEENQEFYLVQQLIAGHPLSDELTPRKQLSEAYAIALLKNILQPLTFVHQNQVIHRDIKPPNLIRRNGDGKIVLIDFGAVKQIATQLVNAQGQTRMTVSIGTPGYMPSEQSRGNPRLSSDIYAVGMIGIQALTGLMPHQLQEDVQTAEIIWRPLVSVSPQLADVLDQMICYDFRQRYQSAAEALAAVQQLQNPYIPPTQPLPPQSDNSTVPLYSPPPPVPPQYRQEIFAPPPPATPKTAPTQPSQVESDNSTVPLYSPPSTVPPQYRQEIPAPPPPATPTTAPTQLSQVEWDFYSQWVLANIGGYLGGLFLAYYTYRPFGISFSLIMYSLWGLLVGILQWLVLPQKLSLSLWSWILATTPAFSLVVVFVRPGEFIANFLQYSQFSYTSPSSSYTFTFIVAIFLLLPTLSGLIVGIGQWFLLRRLVNKAGWWILVNAICGGFCGVTSGAVLVWLLRQPKSQNNG